LEIDEIIRERTVQLRRLQNGIVSVLADMVENRDKATGGHIERTTAYVKLLIHEMQEQGVYGDEIRNWDFDTTVSSARLHDVGKIVISDIVLNKHGKLTDDEFNKVKTHAIEGERIVDQIAASTGEEDFLSNAKLFAGYHHERWDGKGYPRGLKETEIPLQGRVMAIVDVYDALVSERPYKEAFSDEEVVNIIKDEAGKHFDPNIAKVFLDIIGKIKEITAC
jgi:putative two-component system response regulator